MQNIILEGSDNTPSRIIIAHGSATKGIKKLNPSFMSGMGANGAVSGTGVYTCPLSSVHIPIMYAGSEGSVYLSELDVSEFITISDNHTLDYKQSEIIAEIVNDIEDPYSRYRLSTDLGGKLERTFEDVDYAEHFIDEMNKQVKALGLPDRYSPDIEDYKDGVSVISYHREDIDGYIPVSTNRINSSLNWVGNEFASSVWGKVANGLALENNPDDKNEKAKVLTYLSFSSLDVKYEVPANMGEEQIHDWCVGDYSPPYRAMLLISLANAR